MNPSLRSDSVPKCSGITAQIVRNVHLGRERLILLIENSVDLGTDTAGFMTIRFAEDVRTAFEDLRKRLQAMSVISLAPSSR
jgi:hypothetical protein